MNCLLTNRKRKSFPISFYSYKNLLNRGSVLFFFSGRSHFVQLIGPIHADRRFFDLYVAPRTYLKVYCPVLIYFIDSAMDAGDGNYFVSSLKILYKIFLILGLLCLRANKEKPKNKYH